MFRKKIENRKVFDIVLTGILLSVAIIFSFFDWHLFVIELSFGDIIVILSIFLVSLKFSLFLALFFPWIHFFLPHFLHFHISSGIAHSPVHIFAWSLCLACTVLLFNLLKSIILKRSKFLIPALVFIILLIVFLVFIIFYTSTTLILAKSKPFQFLEDIFHSSHDHDHHDHNHSGENTTLTYTTILTATFILKIVIGSILMFFLNKSIKWFVAIKSKNSKKVIK